jgi:hypothetical protein
MGPPTDVLQMFPVIKDELQGVKHRIDVWYETAWGGKRETGVYVRGWCGEELEETNQQNIRLETELSEVKEQNVGMERVFEQQGVELNKCTLEQGMIGYRRIAEKVRVMRQQAFGS